MRTNNQTSSNPKLCITDALIRMLYINIIIYIVIMYVGSDAAPA